MNLFKKFTNYLKDNKKKIFYYFILGFFFFILSSDFSFAASSSGANTNSGFEPEKWVKIINGVLAGLSGILAAITYFGTVLLDPDFTNGTLFGINDKLHDIWIFISNVVYFIFAFILIWIAFMNIIGKGDKWELKQAMPKFIIGVLIVPFSWMIVSYTVAIANILAISALGLPGDLSTDYINFTKKVEIPKECKIDFSQSSDNKGNSGDSDFGFIKCSDEKVSLADIQDGTVFGLLSAYNFGLIKIDKIDTIDGDYLKNNLIKSIGDLIIYIIFNALYVIVYVILMITLTIVLLVRAIWLWIYMALSPLFGLAYFFGKDSSDLFKKFNFGEFISLALVPFYVMLALSFGFMFLSITLTGITSGNTDGKIEGNNYKLDKDGITISIGPKDEKKQFRLNITGGPFAQLDSSGGGSAFSNGIQQGLGFFGAVFLNIFGVVVFWIAIMAALEHSSITKTVVAPIKQFGESVGQLAQKAPTYIPIFGGVSATGLAQGMRDISSYIESKSMSSGNKFSKFFTGEDNTKIHDMKSAIEQATKSGMNKSVLSKVKNYMTGKTVGDLAKDNNFKDEFYKFLTDILKINKKELESLGIKSASDLSDVHILAKAIKKADYTIDTEYHTYGDLLSGFSKDKNFAITNEEIEKINKDLNPAYISKTNSSNTQNTTNNINIFENESKLFPDKNAILKYDGDNKNKKLNIEKTAEGLIDYLNKEAFKNNEKEAKEELIKVLKSKGIKGKDKDKYIAEIIAEEVVNIIKNNKKN